MGSITIDGVRKSFGADEVLQGIDLAIADGEFVVLVGPSGCGKSTLLRMIAGLEEASAGDIAIDGVRVNDLPPRERDIAMVFQSYALYPHMSVEENMSYSLRLRKAGGERIRRAVDGAAAILGLGDYLERRPKALSGGQRQRVAMGRAIVRQPRAFLFDEPLSNLDARLREQMRAEIRKLHRELGATSVYVTHDQIEAMTMGDRIVAMQDGVVQQIGTPREIYERPANRFVASFIGSPAMNFLPARHEPADGSRRGAVRGGRLTTAFGTLEGLPPLPLGTGERVIVGLRPEDVRVIAPGEDASAHAGDDGATEGRASHEGEGDGRLRGAIEVIEYSGASSLVHLAAGGESMRAVTPGALTHAIGERLVLAVEPARLHLFDTATGTRLN